MSSSALGQMAEEYKKASRDSIPTAHRRKGQKLMGVWEAKNIFKMLMLRDQVDRFFQFKWHKHGKYNPL